MYFACMSLFLICGSLDDSRHTAATPMPYHLVTLQREQNTQSCPITCESKATDGGLYSGVAAHMHI